MSILNFIQLSSLVAKYCKMWKYSPVKFADFVYFCIIAIYICTEKRYRVYGNGVTSFPE